MILKRLALTACLALFSQFAFGQIPYGFGIKAKLYKDRMSKKDLQALNGRTMLVVLDDSTSAYGKALKKGFTNYWTITPYKFVNSTEVLNYLGQQQYAIFALLLYEKRYHQTSTTDPTKIEVEFEDKYTSPNKAPLRVGQMLDAGEFLITQYNFQILLCGNLVKASLGNSLANLKAYNYITPNIFEDRTKPVKYYQGVLAPTVIPFVMRFNSAVKDGMGNNPKSKKEKKSYPIYLDGQRTLLSGRARAWQVNGGFEKLQGKKIYYNSTLINDKGIAFLKSFFNLSGSTLIAANAEMINQLFQTKAADAAILDYSFTWEGTYAFYLSDGTLLVYSENRWLHMVSENSNEEFFPPKPEPVRPQTR